MSRVPPGERSEKGALKTVSVADIAAAHPPSLPRHLWPTIIRRSDGKLLQGFTPEQIRSLLR